MSKQSEMKEEIKRVYLKQLKRNNDSKNNHEKTYSEIHRVFSDISDFHKHNDQVKVQFIRFIIEIGFNKRIGFFDNVFETYNDLYLLFINKELVLDLKHETDTPEVVSM